MTILLQRDMSQHAGGEDADLSLQGEGSHWRPVQWRRSLIDLLIYLWSLTGNSNNLWQVSTSSKTFSKLHLFHFPFWKINGCE